MENDLSCGSSPCTSLSIGGYSVIRRSFHSGLTSELYDAREDMRMFSLALQAVCADSFRSGRGKSAETWQTEFTVYRHEYCVFFLVSTTNRASWKITPKGSESVNSELLTLGWKTIATAKSPVFVNKILLEHNHLLIYCLSC